MRVGDQVNSWVVDTLEQSGKVTCHCICGRTSRTEFLNRFKSASQCFLCKQDSVRAKANERSKSKDLYRVVYSEYKSRAKLKNIDFQLEYDTDFIELIIGTCYYCATPPWRIVKYKLGIAVVTGIDRLDSTLGYVKGNVVSCCQFCNMMKRNMQPEHFIYHANLIAENHPVNTGGE